MKKSLVVKGKKLDFEILYIDDVIDIFIECLNNKNTINRIINVCNMKKISVELVIKLLFKLTKIKVPITYLSLLVTSMELLKINS